MAVFGRICIELIHAQISCKSEHQGRSSKYLLVSIEHVSRALLWMCLHSRSFASHTSNQSYSIHTFVLSRTLSIPDQIAAMKDTTDPPPPYQRCSLHSDPSACTCPVTAVPPQPSGIRPRFWERIFSRRHTEPRADLECCVPAANILPSVPDQSVPQKSVRVGEPAQAKGESEALLQARSDAEALMMCDCEYAPRKLPSRTPTAEYVTEKGVRLLVLSRDGVRNVYCCCTHSSTWESESLDKLRQAEEEDGCVAANKVLPLIPDQGVPQEIVRDDELALTNDDSKAPPRPRSDTDFFQMCDCRTKPMPYKNSRRPTTAFITDKGTMLIVWSRNGGADMYGCCEHSSILASKSLDELRLGTRKRVAVIGICICKGIVQMRFSRIK